MVCALDYISNSPGRAVSENIVRRSWAIQITFEVPLRLGALMRISDFLKGNLRKYWGQVNALSIQK